MDYVNEVVQIHSESNTCDIANGNDMHWNQDDISVLLAIYVCTYMPSCKIKF